ncbi:MAG: SDR family oxidoreductase [Alphaproteobacteria bacterium]|nr:SDR family oxidoreductase [Alphaproteobacteria bacterium]MDE2111829.1 SDR family oxidoreductase [Alphaproteobacteria bacterium]MDE2496145.1 SDR family oxidoreductase [Alphaproteobacteria bacterium]
MNLRDISAIVSGGASGLGEVTARALRRAGAHVAVLDIDGHKVARVAADIDGVGITCDVTDSADTETAVAKAYDQNGSARIVVMCAGIAPAGRILGRDGPMDLASFRKVIEVNLVGTLNLMRLAAAQASLLPPMEDGERAVMVTTASIAAFDGQIGQAAYAASKASVAGLTLPAAREFSSAGIRVCCIAPGIFAAPMLLGMPDDVRRQLTDSVPFPKRLGRPEEFAKLALAIITNPMLNGEVIRLDGALRMAPR